MSIWPLFLYAALSRKPRVLLFTASTFLVLGWIFLAVLFLRTNIRIWEDSQTPYSPFRVGPSMYSLREVPLLLGYYIWIPSVVFYLFIRLMLRWRRRRELLTRFAFSHMLFFALAGILLSWGTMAAVEYSHEDTVWAEDFSFDGWSQVEKDMSFAQVVTLLGEPFQEPITWGVSKGDEELERYWWVRNWSAGYFAVVWFEEGQVHRKHFWYSD